MKNYYFFDRKCFKNRNFSMAIKKKYADEISFCKVTFSIPKEISKKYKKANLVGDFNKWDIEATPLKRLKTTGSFSITLNLETKKEYEFRYLLNREFWLNDPEADKTVPTFFQDAENSVIVL